MIARLILKTKIEPDLVTVRIGRISKIARAKPSFYDDDKSPPGEIQAFALGFTWMQPVFMCIVNNGICRRALADDTRCNGEFAIKPDAREPGAGRSLMGPHRSSFAPVI